MIDRSLIAGTPLWYVHGTEMPCKATLSKRIPSDTIPLGVLVRFDGDRAEYYVDPGDLFVMHATALAVLIGRIEDKVLAWNHTKKLAKKALAMLKNHC